MGKNNRSDEREMSNWMEDDNMYEEERGSREEKGRREEAQDKDTLIARTPSLHTCTCTAMSSHCTCRAHVTQQGNLHAILLDTHHNTHHNTSM